CPFTETSAVNKAKYHSVRSVFFNNNFLPKPKATPASAQDETWQNFKPPPPPPPRHTRADDTESNTDAASKLGKCVDLIGRIKRDDATCIRDILTELSDAKAIFKKTSHATPSPKSKSDPKNRFEPISSESAIGSPKAWLTIPEFDAAAPTESRKSSVEVAPEYLSTESEDS
ncbi:hypothetical protein KEM55_000650, partial [Ascosphaera atra]